MKEQYLTINQAADELGVKGKILKNALMKGGFGIKGDKVNKSTVNYLKNKMLVDF